MQIRLRVRKVSFVTIETSDEQLIDTLAEILATGGEIVDVERELSADEATEAVVSFVTDRSTGDGVSK